jgi:phosphate/sulfate permease
MAYSIGSNDVANVFGTSVGSKALTLMQATILGGVFEFLGAIAMGSNVSNTFKAIIPAQLFAADLFAYQCAMFAALFGSFCFTIFATYRSMPVSTTHAIVGSLIGVGIVTGHAKNLGWTPLITTAISWVVSPIAGCTISYTFFLLIDRLVLRAREPVRRALFAVPVLTFIVFFSLSLFLLLKGPPGIRPPESLGPGFFVGISSAVGLVFTCLSVGWVVHHHRHPHLQLQRVSKHQPVGTTGDLSPVPEETIASSTEMVEIPLHSPNEAAASAGTDALLQDRTVSTAIAESYFVPLMVITAIVLSFSHGGNDVSNAIGPFAAILQAEKTSDANDVQQATMVPFWILILGGAGIVLGLATYGYKVMETLGTHITKLSFSRGFAAQFGSAFSVLVCTGFGLPISTTHVMVGSILGVAMVGGIGNANFGMLKRIGLSWLITIPISAIIGIIGFEIALQFR